MSYSSIKARLTGSIDNLPPASVSNLINDALEDIYRSYDWSFLFKRDFLRTPALISAGTAQVTKYSEFVTLDAAGSAQIFAITADDIPLIERQFRALTQKITGRSWNYNITDYDVSDPNAVILTIDPPYLDENNSAMHYQILKLYYTPPPIIINNIPVIDFRRWEYVISHKWQRRLRTDLTLDEINAFDPGRYYIDEPRYIIPSVPVEENIPTFELYPAPRFERVYEVIYQRKGRKFLDDGTDDNAEVPFTLTDDLVLQFARVRAYEMVAAKAQELKISNVGRMLQLLTISDKAKDVILERAKLADQEAFPRSFLGNYSQYSEFDPLNFSPESGFHAFGTDAIRGYGTTYILDF